MQLRRMGLHHNVQEWWKKAEEVQDAIQPNEPNDERERRQFKAHLVDARLEMSAWQDPVPELNLVEGAVAWVHCEALQRASALES
jgi:hypothetical protein